MIDFLLFFNEIVQSFPMHLEITYSKITDWIITIYRKGLAQDYPASPRDGNDAIIAIVSECDMELCFAKAHVALKEWLCEHNGGY